MLKSMDAQVPYITYAQCVSHLVVSDSLRPHGLSCGKFKFWFLELSEAFFFPNIFDLWLVDCLDSKPADNRS